jgi:hypothetical protein
MIKCKNLIFNNKFYFSRHTETYISRFILLLCFLAFELKLQSQVVDELSLINISIDSTYELKTCLSIIRPPYYKCCEQDTLHGDKLAKCCDNSSVPKQFSVSCSRCVSEKEFDTLKLIMIVRNTTEQLTITKGQKKYLLSRLGKKSKFYDFLKNYKTFVGSRKYDIDSLHQGKIQFIAEETFKKANRRYTFGKSGTQILLGYFSFSSLFIDGEYGLAMYRMSWLGGGECGYQNLILLSRLNGQWRFDKKIMLGVY